MVQYFQDRLSSINPQFEMFESLQTLQVNLGNLCNLACSHCHVNGSQNGTRFMEATVMTQIAGFLRRHPGLTLDITGGCPEMNPDFRFLIDETEGLTLRRLLRSNLAIMAEPGWEWLPEFCRSHNLIVLGSLPCYLEQNVDLQRGAGVYHKSIQVLKRLNSLGYGTDLELNLVYNPGGDFIPGPQQSLESDFKAELLSRHGIIFNHLFTITNAPIGRFRDHLEAEGSYTKYMQLLSDLFNPANAGAIMCRSLISVDWQGKIFNCDFNQALDMPVTLEGGVELTISDFDDDWMVDGKICFAEHCYCCTAGEGSSCTGSLTPKGDETISATAKDLIRKRKELLELFPHHVAL